jgi:diguanylate cyclase (GGDEF)-like protein/putative nucleotidyltransferase with HDIG domain
VTIAGWESPDVYRYLGFLGVAILSSGMQISLPGITGTLSLTFLFVLFGLAELTVSETTVLAAVMTLIQCYWNQPRRPRTAMVVFNVSTMVLATFLAARAYSTNMFAAFSGESALRLAGATLVFFMANTAPVALIIALSESKPFWSTWRSCDFWAFPYYLGGAAIAELVSMANHYMGWQWVLLTGPVVYLIYRSYGLYLERLENEKEHAEEVSSLHLRTIEALALAIEAKDHTTRDHLQRVQVYAMEMAKELHLSRSETEALRAASLLHDIGKLAVPEHIISKPGRLTPEEFDKMKIHPIVGAEILERVRFPYPVVPIVRSHHEKWDGSGYPQGLAGDKIPVGARILAVVDCLDALASDRQYRRALPLEEAMRVVLGESGKAFDPAIVEVLAAHYTEWEAMAKLGGANADKLSKDTVPNAARLSTDIKVERGLAPAAGFEKSAGPQGPAGAINDGDFLSSIAAARQEVQALFEISQDLGNSLSLNETLSVLGIRLRRIIPHHAMAIWVVREGLLAPEYVNGEDYRLFSSLAIPVGQGLSGWVAENRKPILNGNPSVEPGYLNDPTKFSTLRSATAVPLEGMNGVIGVVTLYHSEKDAFTKDHLRVLLAIGAKIGMAIENALRFRQVESSATTDFLTGLPNARSLFLQLDAELARCRRTVQPLAILVTDLDGFKQINDRYGHLDGNKVLKAIADGFKSVCREYDYVARMGGDEFVILLPGVRAEDCTSKLEQLRHVVRDVCRNLFAEDLLGASIGVAVYPGDGRDAEQLLAEADRRMYTEKRTRKSAKGGVVKTDRRWSATIQ